MDDTADNQRWLQMLALLGPVSSLAAVRGTPSNGAHQTPAGVGRRHQDSVRESTHVKILERLSPTSIVVSLADATSGRYGDQTWVLRTARRKGFCLLSGEPFLPGDPVYRANARPHNITIATLAISVAAIAHLEEDVSFPLLDGGLTLEIENG